MTSVLDPPQEPLVVGGDPAASMVDVGAPRATPSASGSSAAPPPPPPRASANRRVLLVAWLVAIVVGFALVVYGFGPFFHQRSQRTLLATYRGEISKAANEASGLPGVQARTTAPDPGEPVGILEIPSVRMQQVVVEGVGAEQTRAGPGHVPGTAAPGQPGNAVVVGRNKAFGGPFGQLSKVHEGDEILVTTTQGASIYTVNEVRTVRIATAPADPSSAVSTVDATDATDARGDAGTGPVRVDDLYGPSDDDRLTLVTSASWTPWNDAKATVVTATMKDAPFPATPQGGRLSGQTGLSGDDGALASVILALMAYGLVMGAAVLVYRRMKPRTAYLVTIGPILALTIIAAETLSRVFPAWM